MNTPLAPQVLLLIALAVTLPSTAAETPLPFGLSPVAAPAESTSPHVAMARELVDILSRTEAALDGCRDAESVSAALPVLREQRERLHRAAATQRELPDPDKEEIRTVNEQFADLFASLADKIRQHMRRLEDAGLATPELVKLMQLPRSAKAAR